MNNTNQLSPKQIQFLADLQNGKTPSRNINDVTGKALARKGLVQFVVMVGWIATAAGLKLELKAA
ncbi:TPA: hypothetical protein ACGD48_004771 [Serratia marcescens]